MRVQTNVLCDENLKNAAKMQRISLSRTLEDALADKLALPARDRKSIAEQKAEFERKIAYLNSREAQMAEAEALVQLQLKRQEQSRDIEALKRLRKMDNEKKLKEGAFYKVLGAFCLKYGCSVNQALSLMSKERPPEPPKEKAFQTNL